MAEKEKKDEKKAKAAAEEIPLPRLDKLAAAANTAIAGHGLVASEHGMGQILRAARDASLIISKNSGGRKDLEELGSAASAVLKELCELLEIS